MDYMQLAGYDPREAYKAYEALSKKAKDKPNFSGAERSGYSIVRIEAAKQLREVYKDAHFATDKTDAEGYKEFVRDAEIGGRK